jgi:hypothetical protein
MACGGPTPNIAGDGRATFSFSLEPAFPLQKGASKHTNAPLRYVVISVVQWLAAVRPRACEPPLKNWIYKYAGLTSSTDLASRATVGIVLGSADKDHHRRQECSQAKRSQRPLLAYLQLHRPCSCIRRSIQQFRGQRAPHASHRRELPRALLETTLRRRLPRLELADYWRFRFHQRLEEAFAGNAGSHGGLSGAQGSGISPQDVGVFAKRIERGKRRTPFFRLDSLLRRSTRPFVVPSKESRCCSE